MGTSMDDIELKSPEGVREDVPGASTAGYGLGTFPTEAMRSQTPPSARPPDASQVPSRHLTARERLHQLGYGPQEIASMTAEKVLRILEGGVRNSTLCSELGTSGRSSLGLLERLPVFLTVAEVGTLLRTTRKAIYAMIERGQLPGVTRIGRRRLLSSADLLDWLHRKRAPWPGV